MDKSYVTMEQKLCVVCARPYDTGTILLDKRLRSTFEPKTVTGIEGLCPEHLKLYQDGMIALVEVDPDKTVTLANGNIDQQEAYRTGKVVHIKRSAFERVFNMPPEKEGKLLPVAFVEPAVTALLEKLMKEAEAECPVCRSKGFTPSVTGKGCTFCDGTEGGNLQEQS